MRIKSIVSILSLIILITTLIITIEIASARWILYDVFSGYVERVCRNGIILSGHYGDEWFDWDTAFDGSEWITKTVTLDNQPITVNAYASGPTTTIDGVQFLGKFVTLYWDDLYPGIPPGGVIPSDDLVWVDTYTDRPGNGWPYFYTAGLVEGCMIEENLPGLSMYQYCSIDGNHTINYPASLTIVDMDVSMAVNDILDIPISGRMSAPNGTDLTLFNNLSAAGQIDQLGYGTCGLLDSGFILDDEADDLWGISDYFGIWEDANSGSWIGGGNLLPVESLSTLDNSSSMGTWQLSFSDSSNNPHPAELQCWCLDILGFQDNSVYLPAVVNSSSSIPPPPANPLANPGFEAGATGWTEFSSNGFAIIYDDNSLPVSPHSGSWAAWLAGVHDEISYVQQQITVPAAGPHMTYWHYIASEDYCGYDFGSVLVNGNVVVDVFDLCTDQNTNGWIQRSVDLTAYAGQTILVELRAETDGSLYSSLYVDDVAFQSTSALTANPPDSLINTPVIGLQKQSSNRTGIPTNLQFEKERVLQPGNQAD